MESLMSSWTTLLFLLGVYWPYVAAAAGIGLITGWLSLSREPAEK